MSYEIPAFLRKQHGDKISFWYHAQSLGVIVLGVLALLTLLLFILPLAALLNLGDRLFKPRTSFVSRFDRALTALLPAPPSAAPAPTPMRACRCAMPQIWGAMAREQAEFAAYSKSLQWVEHPDHPRILAADGRPPVFLMKEPEAAGIPDVEHAV